MSRENLHITTPPMPWDDYPREPTRGWMIEALVSMGEPPFGSNADLARRLRELDFDVTPPAETWPPPVPGPDDPHPAKPTTGWMRHTLVTLFDVAVRGMDDDDLRRELRARGYKVGAGADDEGRADR
jgi:hypothetical protein